MLVQVIPPFLVDPHGLGFSGCTLGREPLGLGVLDHVLNMIWVHRIEDVEEVYSVWAFFIWVLVLEVNSEVLVIFHIFP